MNESSFVVVLSFAASEELIRPRGQVASLGCHAGLHQVSLGPAQHPDPKGEGFPSVWELAISLGSNDSSCTLHCKSLHGGNRKQAGISPLL